MVNRFVLSDHKRRDFQVTVIAINNHSKTCAIQA